MRAGRFGIVAVALGLMLVACGPEENPSARDATDAPEELEVAEAAEPEFETRIEGFSFYVHDRETESAGRVRPLLSLQAAEAYTEDGEAMWRINGIEGELQRKGAEALRFLARSGTVNQNTNYIELEGPLRLQSESLDAEFPNLVWDEAAQEAISDGESMVRWRDSELRSSGARVHTQDERILLFNPSGTVTLQGVTP